MILEGQRQGLARGCPLVFPCDVTDPAGNPAGPSKHPYRREFSGLWKPVGEREDAHPLVSKGLWTGTKQT